MDEWVDWIDRTINLAELINAHFAIENTYKNNVLSAQ